MRVQVCLEGFDSALRPDNLGSVVGELILPFVIGDLDV